MCAVTSSGNEGRGFLKGRKGGFHKAFKSKTSWLPKLQLPKGIFQRSSCKTEPSQRNNLSKSTDVDDKKTYTNLSPTKTLGCTTTDQTKIKTAGSRRRQNSTSSNSTFYGSMSSDMSIQSQDTSKRNQGSYTTQSIQSAPSSCDPLSLWGSCRSSEVSSNDGLSPASSIRIKSLQTDGRCPTSISSHPINKCDDNQNFAPSAPLTDQKDVVNYYNSCHDIKTSENDSKLSTSEQLESNKNDRVSPIQGNPQFLPHRNASSHQNTDWNQNNIYEKDLHTSKIISDSVTLDCNKDLILPDDVVSYLNDVSRQEVENCKSFYQNNNLFQTPLKTDCCSNCKMESHQNPTISDSSCNQSHVSVPNAFYQNCTVQHHINMNSSNCITQDANQINCNHVQNSFKTNSVNYQSNGCKNEYIPQSCHQGASQNLMNHCSQQAWNTQNSHHIATMQNKVCSTRVMNTFYCNQEHYNNPPTYQITPPYNTNNLHLQSPVENRCSMGKCIDSQTMHAPPINCNYQQAHQFSNQQTGFKCSQMCDASNTMQSQCYPVPVNFNMHHQQGSQNLNCLHQYQQCANCGVGQNLPLNPCFSSNTVPNSNNNSQFITPSHTVQCMPLQNIPHLVNSASLEVVLPKSEKTDFEKQNCSPPKTEAVSVSCADSISKIRITPVPNQNSSFQNIVNQGADTVPNVSLTPVQSLLPSSNMIINDMNSILSSLMEETKYLKLLQ